MAFYLFELVKMFFFAVPDIGYGDVVVSLHLPLLIIRCELNLMGNCK